MRKYLFSAIMAVIVIFAVLVCGFMLSTTNNTTVTAHDTFLEKYVNETYKNLSSQKNRSLENWDVHWRNNTSVNIIFTVQNNITGNITKYDRIVMHFKSVDDATTYTTGLNLTEYALMENVYTGGPYQDLVGHAPDIYKWYRKDMDTRLIGITQIDDLVLIDKYTVVR